MSLTYDLNIDIKIPDFIKKDFPKSSEEKDVPDVPAEKEVPKEKTYKKKRNEKSELDLLIDKIIKEKKEIYEVVSPTLNQYREILPDRLMEWESSPELFDRYEGDFVGYMLDSAVSYAFEMEQIQRQKFL